MGTFVEKVKMPLKVVSAGAVVAALVLFGNAFIAEQTVMMHPSALLQATCMKDGPAIVAGDGSWTSHIAPDGQLLYNITLGNGMVMLTSDEVRGHCLAKLSEAPATEAFVRTLFDPFGPWRQVS